MVELRHKQTHSFAFSLAKYKHMTVATLQARQPVQWFLGRWTKEELIAVLEHLYRKTGDRAYRSVGELARRSLAPTTRPLL